MKSILPILLTTTLITACATTKAPEPVAQETRRVTPEPARAPAKVEFSKLLALSTKFAGQGDTAKANKYASLAVKQYPEKPDAWAILGLTEAQVGKLAEAVRSYEKSLELGQSRREVYEQLASVYDIQKRYADAERIYKAYLTLDPKDGVMLHQLGLTLLGRGDLPGAISHLERAEAALAPGEKGPDIYIDLGYAHIKADNWRKARPYLAKAFDPAAQKPMPLGLLVELLGSMTDPKAALDLIDAFGEQPHSEKLIKLRAHVAGQVK